MNRTLTSIASAALMTAALSLTATAHDDPGAEVGSGTPDSRQETDSRRQAAVTYDASLRTADGLSFDDENPDAATACTADVTFDDAVDWQDFLRILLYWGPCADEADFGLRTQDGESFDDGRCENDLDGDGEVGFNEMLMVLTQWGQCG